MSFKSFEELDCWKVAREVKQLIRSISKKLPPSEKYDLVDNMTRAARSVTRNIAEGFGRYTYKENIRFCLIARGSLIELIDDMITCHEEKYISDNEYSEARKLIDRAAAVLNGYINYLDREDLNKNSNASENFYPILPEPDLRITINE